MATDTQVKVDTQGDVLASSSSSNGNGVTQGQATSSKRRKLHGRAFYESIGSPRLVLAPMVEQSEFVGFLHTLSLLFLLVGVVG